MRLCLCMCTETHLICYTSLVCYLLSSTSLEKVKCYLETAFPASELLCRLCIKHLNQSKLWRIVCVKGAILCSHKLRGTLFVKYTEVELDTFSSFSVFIDQSLRSYNNPTCSKTLLIYILNRWFKAHAAFFKGAFWFIWPWCIFS